MGFGSAIHKGNSSELWNDPYAVLVNRITAAEAAASQAAAIAAVDLMSPPANTAKSFLTCWSGGALAKLRFFMRKAAAGGTAGILLYQWDAAQKPNNNAGDTPDSRRLPMGQIMADFTLTFSGAFCTDKTPIVRETDTGGKWYEASDVALSYIYSANAVTFSTFPAADKSVACFLDVIAGHDCWCAPYSMTAATELIVAAKRIQ